MTNRLGFDTNPGTACCQGGQSAPMADFNGDGRLDIVSVDSDSKTFTILLNRGP